MQQALRHSANDPQIQMAEDTASLLSTNQLVQTVLPKNAVDIGKSLAPYIIIYDTNGNVIASSATLHGQTPRLPPGVFTDARQKELRFTWQPEEEVRSAVVIINYNNGFVLAGRSLREVENREDHLTKEVFGVWALAIIISFFPFVFFAISKK